MISLAQFKLSRLTAGRRIGAVAMLGALAMFASACAVQETNTYPVEIFSEMHYAQYSRSQEPPRLQPLAESVVFQDIEGGPEAVLNVPEAQQRPYNAAVAARLFENNCSVCHGVNGMGDGPAAAHLKSDQSFFATQNGATYATPPNLAAIRVDRTPQALFNTISNGIIVMPSFGHLLSDEEIWDIVAYIKDEQTGLGTAQ